MMRSRSDAVHDEAGTLVTLYGQEKDAATSGLARMNMILHNNPTAMVEHRAILSETDAEIAAVEAKLVKAGQLRQGMIQELMTGGIRLA